MIITTYMHVIPLNGRCRLQIPASAMLQTNCVDCHLFRPSWSRTRQPCLYVSVQPLRCILCGPLVATLLYLKKIAATAERTAVAGTWRVSNRVALSRFFRFRFGPVTFFVFLWGGSAPPNPPLLWGASPPNPPS